MIRLTRLNNSEILLNSDLIGHIELTADTVVTLTNGSCYVVRETSDEILERIVQFKKRILQDPVSGSLGAEPEQA